MKEKTNFEIFCENHPPTRHMKYKVGPRKLDDNQIRRML